MEGIRKEFREMVFLRAFKYAEIPTFKLVCGEVSRFYFNCKEVMTDPYGKFLIGELIFDRIAGLDVVSIGGLELGSVFISGAVSLTSYYRGSPIREFAVRKKPKDHGTTAKIEGRISQGDRVVVVDDVITTGGSTIDAIKAVVNAGAIVVKAIVLVDRQEFDGRKKIEEYCPIESLVTRAEIFDLYKTRVF
jgi:orotate phosphoribosyltransferase